MPSTLFRVKAVPRISVFCKHGVTIKMSFFYRQSLKLRDIVLSAPITTRTTSAFSFHSFPTQFYSQILVLVYFFLFIFSVFWSPGMAISLIKQLFAILLMHTILGRLCSITLSVWIGKTHKILHPSFSSTESWNMFISFVITFQVGLFAWQLVDLFATLSDLFRYLVFAGANDVCDTFNIFVLKPATWSLTGFVNAILY